MGEMVSLQGHRQERRAHSSCAAVNAMGGLTAKAPADSDTPSLVCSIEKVCEESDSGEPKSRMETHGREIKQLPANA